MILKKKPQISLIHFLRLFAPYWFYILSESRADPNKDGTFTPSFRRCSAERRAGGVVPPSVHQVPLLSRRRLLGAVRGAEVCSVHTRENRSTDQRTLALIRILITLSQVQDSVILVLIFLIRNLFYIFRRQSRTNATITFHEFIRVPDLYKIPILCLFFFQFVLSRHRKYVFRWRYCSLRRRERERRGWKEEKVGQFSRDLSDPAHRSRVSTHLEEMSGDAIKDGD